MKTLSKPAFLGEEGRNTTPLKTPAWTAKINRSLFQKVLILVQKAPKLVGFKKELEKKLKISKTIAEIPKA